MAYAVDVARPLVPEALELLSDAVLNPRFEAWEVDAARARLAADAAAMREGNPQGGLLEALHEVAYTGALARPLLAPAEVLSRLTPEALAAFVAENYAPPRVVLAAAGVGHSELVSLAAPLLEAAGPPSGAPAPAPESKYVGGDCRQFSAGGVTHLMLGFEAAGGWRDVPGSVAVTVLQFLLGGGGSFSAGGPGKGMHSRLYSRVLARHGWVRTCAAFSSLYNASGLVGVYAAADSSSAAQLVDVVSSELQELASRPVPAAELERAKAAALSSVLMNLESRAVVAEDVGRQVLTYGARKPVAEFVDAIKALTPASMQAAVKKATATPLSMAALGDIAALPRYSEVAARFK
jgi:processing peptidase subunit alpha